MRYFKTKYEKDSAKITLLISLILLLMIFVMGPQHLEEPEEYGVAVNFGTTNFGKGNIQPKNPIKSEPREVNEPPQPNVSKTEPTKSSEVKEEEVLTQETEEAIAIRKKKEAEAKAKAIAEAKAKAEAERIAKEKREQEKKRKELDALIGGVSKSDGSETGGEGDDDKAGDKGQLDGNPYAPSYFGGSGPGKGGVGYGLGGRGRPTRSIYKQDCNEFGLVVVKIVVNRSGNVVSATPGVRGTTNTASCLLEPAKRIALSHKWPADSKAPAKQIGFVSINFDVGQ